jgi:hypothetical protein
MSYHLPEGYVERLGAPQSYDIGGDDKWQDEVYAEARKLYDSEHLSKVLDWGTGSGFKLVKHFGDLDSMNVMGADLDVAVDRLRDVYPGRVWGTADSFPVGIPIDLVICADVIEHVDNPSALLSALRDIGPKWLVISTPDRELMAKYPKWGRPQGPPSNGCHVREWSFDEFRKYMDEHFEVVRHWISNPSQCTQAMTCKPR